MLRSYRKVPIILLLCVSMLILPAAAAQGFGRGATGSDVYAVQAMLKTLGYFPATITGHYGMQTDSAVRKFQAAYGLPVTGAVDENTMRSILQTYESMKMAQLAPP